MPLNSFSTEFSIWVRHTTIDPPASIGKFNLGLYTIAGEEIQKDIFIKDLDLSKGDFAEKKEVNIVPQFEDNGCVPIMFLKGVTEKLKKLHRTTDSRVILALTLTEQPKAPATVHVNFKTVTLPAN